MISRDTNKKAEIVAMLDQLAEMLIWQEPGAADRCFNVIENEERITTTN